VGTTSEIRTFLETLRRYNSLTRTRHDIWGVKGGCGHQLKAISDLALDGTADGRFSGKASWDILGDDCQGTAMLAVTRHLALMDCLYVAGVERALFRNQAGLSSPTTTTRNDKGVIANRKAAVFWLLIRIAGTSEDCLPFEASGRNTCERLQANYGSL